MQKWLFAVLLVLVGGGAWYALRDKETPPVPVAQPAATPATPPPEAAA